MNNDLISREALKKAVENLVAGGEERLKDYYENGSKSEENEWIGGVYDAWELIGNAPTVERPQGDLISRIWLKEHKFTTQVCNGLEIESVDVVAVATIDNAPTVESDKELYEKIETYKNSYRIMSDAFENEVRKNKRPHGEWVIDGHHYKCSRCGKTLAIMFSETDDDLIGCPFCLADMRGGRE